MNRFPILGHRPLRVYTAACGESVVGSHSHNKILLFPLQHFPVQPFSCTILSCTTCYCTEFYGTIVFCTAVFPQHKAVVFFTVRMSMFVAHCWISVFLTPIAGGCAIVYLNDAYQKERKLEIQWKLVLLWYLLR